MCVYLYNVFFYLFIKYIYKLSYLFKFFFVFLILSYLPDQSLPRYAGVSKHRVFSLAKTSPGEHTVCIADRSQKLF